MPEYKASKRYPSIEVTRCGKVYSHNTKSHLSGTLTGGGYRLVSFRVNGKRNAVFVHRLVAECYVENPELKPFVNHLDGVKTNNHYSNLEWCTHQENVSHALASGLFKASREKRIDDYIESLKKIKPWDRESGLKTWSKKNGIKYTTAKAWHKKIKDL